MKTSGLRAFNRRWPLTANLKNAPATENTEITERIETHRIHDKTHLLPKYCGGAGSGSARKKRDSVKRYTDRR